MEIKIELQENLIKAISTLANAWHIPLEKTIEFMLIGDVARKAAFGDVLHVPEIGVECVREPDGRMLEGESLYKDVYSQVVAWLNSLIIAEKLVATLAAASEITELKDPRVQNAYTFYKEKKEFWN